MSLINQMLRDLDARRGTGGNAQLGALQGIGLVRPRHPIQRPNFTRTARALGGMLLVLAGFAFSLAGSDPAAEHAGWTPLALPEAAPRSRASARRATALPADPAPREPWQENAGSASGGPVRTPQPGTTNSRPVAAVLAENKPQAPPPVVASATLEPLTSQSPQRLRTQNPEQQAQLQFAQAQRALADENWQRAEQLLNQTLEVLPGHQEARGQLASLLMARQADDSAEHMLAAGLAIDPHARALAKPYAQLLAARGALQAALDVLAEVPPDAETTALRAAILHRIGNHAEAASAYEDALREQPEQAVWWTGLAIAREHNQEPRKALQAYRRAARLQLSDPVREYVEHRMQALQPRDGQ